MEAASPLTAAAYAPPPDVTAMAGAVLARWLHDYHAAVERMIRDHPNRQDSARYELVEYDRPPATNFDGNEVSDRVVALARICPHPRHDRTPDDYDPAAPRVVVRRVRRRAVRPDYSPGLATMALPGLPTIAYMPTGRKL